MKKWLIAGLLLATVAAPVAVIVAVVLVAAGSQNADADVLSCTAAPSPVASGSPTPPVGGLDAEQRQVVNTIISTGAALNVPARGLIVAVATARQESGWRNLPGGDRDSVGVFQQRPSQGWGTVAQLQDPAYASRKFYEALLAVPGWQQMEVTQAAQAVQRSAFPTAYAQWVGIAAQLVAGSGAATCSDPGAAAGVQVADCSFRLARTPPRTCAEAIQWALDQRSGPPVWYRACLAFVARAYGMPSSGVGPPYTAREYWLESGSKHPGDTNPPAGALVFWNGGSAGHVALSAGNRMVISNDIRGNGTIALVPMDEITTRWNDPYLGWTLPNFPPAG